ncbi:MAG: hypothetical protein ACFFCY_13610 [Promethearchaeota archaeon]
MHKYYCNKCRMHHHRGKIYKDHYNYKNEEIIENNDKNPDDGGIKINFDDLRPIAKRQLQRLYKKMKSSENHDLYKIEIMKLIKKENGG